MNTNKHREVPAAITQLRAELESLSKGGEAKRRTIPEALKRRVVDAFIGSGLKPGAVASALSINDSVLNRWRKQFGGQRKPAKHNQTKRLAGGFKKVAVVTAPEMQTGRFTIEGPNGLKITGLGVDDVARLWKTLC